MQRTYSQLALSIVQLLNDIKSRINEDTDVFWAGYESAGQLTATIDSYILRVTEFDDSAFRELNVEFAPTGTYQELSMSNGWAKEYLILAERFDELVCADMPDALRTYLIAQNRSK